MTNNSFENFHNICRLCSMEKDNLNLMEHSPHLHILKNMTEVKIELDDGLPKNVCNECTNKLHYISCFINLCIKSQIKLKNILEKHKIELHPQVEDLDQPFSPVEEELKNDVYKKCDIVKHTLIPTERVFEKENHEYLKDVLEKPSTKRQPSDCEVCGGHFSTKTKLNEHKKKNLDCRTKQCSCTICDKGFVTKFKLKLHMRSHTKETPFECKICLKKFRFASNVNRHVDVVHKGLKPFKCDICGKGFTRNSNLAEHKRDHSGKQPFVCSYCGLSFNKTASYHYHLNLHKATNSESNANLTCDICARVFSSQSSLRKHKLTHTKENIFLCDMCGKNFRTNQTLVNHINVHLGVKSFECRFCDKTFSRKSTLKVHCLSHTKEKPFKCNACLKTFAQIVHLKNHERIHNGEKPYQCSFCNRKFSVKCNLVIHTRIHTKDTKYKCTVCGKMYYESRSLKRHMKIHQDSSLIVLTNEDISTLLS